MEQKFSYYSIKSISVLIFLYSAIMIYGTIATMDVTSKLQSSFIGSGNQNLYNQLFFTLFLFLLNALLGVVAGISLFFFRKFGFYSAISSILIFGILRSLQGAGISGAWLSISIGTIILVYLIYQRKFILGFRNQSFAKAKP